VKRGTGREVAEKIRKIKDAASVLVIYDVTVRMAGRNYGMWDIVARIETESLGKLNKIVTEVEH